MRSCERPRKRSASVALPSSVSNRYFLSIRTQGSSCRRRASSSLRRVRSFSDSSSSRRAASQSLRVLVLWSVIVSLLEKVAPARHSRRIAWLASRSFRLRRRIGCNPLRIIGFQPRLRFSERWRHIACETIAQDAEVSMPTAGDTEHFAEATMRQHQEHLVGARRELEPDFGIPGGAAPREGKQARRLTRGDAALHAVLAAVLCVLGR